MVIACFSTNGYTVSIPLNDTQDYDLVVEKDGVFQSVQCKFGGEEIRNNDDAYGCSLRSIGAKGTYHGSVKDSKADLLFCLRPDKVMYLIPVKDININTLRLTTSKSKFSSGFDTSKYIVEM
jgi:hypothetical protein